MIKKSSYTVKFTGSIGTLIRHRDMEFKLSAELNYLISDKDLLGAIYELLN